MYYPRPNTTHLLAYIGHHSSSVGAHTPLPPSQVLLLLPVVVVGGIWRAREREGICALKTTANNNDHIDGPHHSPPPLLLHLRSVPSHTLRPPPNHHHHIVVMVYVVIVDGTSKSGARARQHRPTTMRARKKDAPPHRHTHTQNTLESSSPLSFSFAITFLPSQRPVRIRTQ